MRNYIYLILLTLGSLIFSGCADDTPDGPNDRTEEGYIEIRVASNLSDSPDVRSTADPLNENTVSTLALYFYPKNGFSEEYSEPLLTQFFDLNSSEIIKNGTVQVPLPENCTDPGRLFAGKTPCVVYAVANMSVGELNGPSSLSSTLDKRTVSELKQTVVYKEFEKTVIQDRFSMDGISEVTLKYPDGDTTQPPSGATGEIELTRSCAKITLSLNVPVDGLVVKEQEGGVEKDVKYTPAVDQMHVWITDGVSTSKLNVAADFQTDDSYYYSNNQALGAIEGNGSDFEFVEGGLHPSGNDRSYNYTQCIPFYSFPNKWHEHAPQESTFLTVAIPWRKEGETVQQMTYYRVAVQAKDFAIERGMYYDMYLNVGKLGSNKPQEPVELETFWTYELPWNTVDFHTDIKKVRYLYLNSNNLASDGVYEYVIDNETSLTIPFTSSHQVEIVAAQTSISWDDLVNSEARKVTGADYYTTTGSYSAAADQKRLFGLNISSTNDGVEYRRALKHISYETTTSGGGGGWGWPWGGGGGSTTTTTITQTAEDAVNVYTIELTIKHTDIDDATYTKKIRIIQYPARYVVALNSGSSSNQRFVNGKNSGSTDLGSISSSNNHNTYMISVSKLDPVTMKNYVIGDPRLMTVDNKPNNSDSKTDPASWSSSQKPLDGGDNRKLTYYYPTDTDPSKNYFIAPRYRVASQWGVTTAINKAKAERRCASYQEGGFPAGRWRLPTVAEIEYIAYLSTKKLIPYLFGESNERNKPYWTGAGLATVNNVAQTVTIDNNPNVDDTNFVRCVYDDWYWGSDPLPNDQKTTFYWGDKPRTSSGNKIIKRFTRKR